MKPDDLVFETMVAFACGELSPEASAEIRRALLASPDADARVRRVQLILQTLREDDSVDVPSGALSRAKAIFAVRPIAQESWLRKVEQIVATLLFDSFNTPAAAGVRGEHEARQLSYGWTDAQLDLEVERLPQRQERMLIGQLETKDVRADVQVALVPAGTRAAVADAAADESGVFTMRAPAGTYDLLVLSGETVIKIPGIEMR